MYHFKSLNLCFLASVLLIAYSQNAFASKEEITAPSLSQEESALSPASKKANTSSIKATKEKIYTFRNKRDIKNFSSKVAKLQEISTIGLLQLSFICHSKSDIIGDQDLIQVLKEINAFPSLASLTISIQGTLITNEGLQTASLQDSLIKKFKNIKFLVLELKSRNLDSLTGAGSFAESMKNLNSFKLYLKSNEIGNEDVVNVINKLPPLEGIYLELTGPKFNGKKIRRLLNESPQDPNALGIFIEPSSDEGDSENDNY